MIRNTRQRKLIMDTIVDKKVHLTTSQVYELVNKDEQAISLATVYRTLNSLAQQGKIRYVTTINHEAIYDGVTSRHDHFVCTCCGKLMDVDDVVSASTINNIQNKYNIKINKTNTLLTGICEQCLGKEN